MSEADEITHIPYWEVEKLWPTVGPMIQKAVDRVPDELPLDSVYKRLLNPADPAQTQLWYIPGKFALITQIQFFPTGIRKCLLFLGGGEDIVAIAAAQPIISEWAKRYYGCSKLIIYGRRGFLKKLSGFQEMATIMEAQI